MPIEYKTYQPSNQHNLNPNPTPPSLPIPLPTRGRIYNLQKYLPRILQILFQQDSPIDIPIFFPIERSSDTGYDVALAELGDFEDGGEEGIEGHAGAEFEGDAVGGEGEGDEEGCAGLFVRD